MTRIFWNRAEKEVVAARSFAIKNYASFDDSDIEAVRQAMAECLPDEKQRKLHAMSEVFWIYDYWDDLENPRKTANSSVDHNLYNVVPPTKQQAIHPVVNPQI